MPDQQSQGPKDPGRSNLPTQFVVFVVVASALALFLLAWESTTRSRSDSMALLVEEGKAFTQALAEASRNAMLASSYYDRLVEEHYFDLTSVLNDEPLEEMTDERLAAFVRSHDLAGVYVFDPDTNLIASFGDRGARLEPPDWVVIEIAQLVDQREVPFVLLIDQDTAGDPAVHYFIALSNRMDRVIVLSTYAQYHTEATLRTGIGVLSQAMSREQGVEYIMYQSTEGIIFASRNTEQVLAIESDPFLQLALEQDTISHRLYDFQNSPVLELVRPFATPEYEFGLFRVGMSLDRFYAVSRGFDQRMIVLGIALFAFLVAVILYFNSRRRGREIRRQYTQYKSVADRVFQDIRTGIVLTDASGIISLANPAFEDLIGDREVTGRDWNEIFPDEQLRFEEFMSGRVDIAETELSAALGDAPRTLLVVRSKLPAIDKTGQMLVAVVYDMTGIRKLERQSARRERLSEMGNLAAGVAHEIRNPLNTISIAAQRLASEFTPKERQQEYKDFTESIRRETKRLNDIITRFLALTREQEKGRQTVRIDQIIEEMVELIRPEAERLRITLDIQVESDLSIQADPNRLKQVFSNLFNNAKEALKGAPGKVAIAATSQRNSVGVLFADSGPGIPSDQREKVLTPYFTSKEGGTGLGLSVVHTIVTEIGGELEIGQSELGGAEIVILLPAATQSSA